MFIRPSIRLESDQINCFLTYVSIKDDVLKFFFFLLNCFVCAEFKNGGSGDFGKNPRTVFEI